MDIEYLKQYQIDAYYENPDYKDLSTMEKGFVLLGKELMKPYRSNPEWFLSTLNDYPSILESLYMAYSVVSGLGGIKKIEELPEAEKWKLFNEAKRIAPEANKEKNIKICKALTAINYLNDAG